MNFAQVIDAIFESLREMDREATTYGLRGLREDLEERGYVGDLGAGDELPMYRVLASKLTNRGFPTTPDCIPYPGTGKKCDFVIDLPEGKFWIEAKVAYTVYGTTIAERAINTNRKLKEVVTDWNKKLLTLQPDEQGSKELGMIASIH